MAVSGPRFRHFDFLARVMGGNNCGPGWRNYRNYLTLKLRRALRKKDSAPRSSSTDELPDDGSRMFDSIAANEEHLKKFSQNIHYSTRKNRAQPWALSCADQSFRQRCHYPTEDECIDKLGNYTYGRRPRASFGAYPNYDILGGRKQSSRKKIRT